MQRNFNRIAFFWVGADTAVPTLLVKSIRAVFGAGFEVVQLSPTDTPMIAGVSTCARGRLSPDIMVARLEAYAGLPVTQPTLFLDADMLLTRGFDLPQLAENEVGVTLREDDGSAINWKYPLEFPEFRGRRAFDVMPYIYSFVYTRSGEIFTRQLERLKRLPDRFHKWYGDQVTLKAELDSGRFVRRIFDAGLYNRTIQTARDLQAIAGAGKTPCLLHFKGPAGKEIMLGATWQGGAARGTGANAPGGATQEARPAGGGGASGGVQKFGWFLPEDDVAFSAYLEQMKDDPRCVLDGRVLYQPMHIFAVERYLKAFPGTAAIDVGAHVGFWSYVLCKRFRKVYAFEPSASMRSLFSRNVVSANVELLPVALADAVGRGTLHYVAGNSGASFMKFGENGEVECRTLDSYGLTGIGFLKIDVEGAEFQVLEGARETIGESKPLIIVEQKQHGARYGHDPEGVRQLLRELGYVRAETVVADEIYVPAPR